MIISEIYKYIQQALTVLSYPEVKFTVDKSKSVKFGDFNTNVAMLLVKTPIAQELKKSPLDIAQEIAEHINPKILSKIEVVKPGFINFYLKPEVNQELFQQINLEDEASLNLNLKT